MLSAGIHSLVRRSGGELKPYDRSWGKTYATPPSPTASLVRGTLGVIAFSNAHVNPILYFLLHPSDPALTKLYPLGELPGRFKAGDVLRAIKNQIAHLLSG